MEQPELPWGDVAITGQPYNLTDANDKQWYIECAVLENEKLALRARVIEAEAAKGKEYARIAEAELQKAITQLEQTRLDAEIAKDKPEQNVSFRTSCRCNADFSYEGPASEVNELYDTFVRDHSGC